VLITFFFLLDTYIRKTLAKTPSDIGKKIEYFLSTGNLVTTSGLDLQQVFDFFEFNF